MFVFFSENRENDKIRVFLPVGALHCVLARAHVFAHVFCPCDVIIATCFYFYRGSKMRCPKALDV